jgi:prepilin signal peptidase PulO-like enzyme (type II secretory pathway)
MVIVAMVLLGLCFGSFVNALVWRLHKKKDWVKERSVCTHCGHVLAAKDLVPVLSWIELRGKCRYCHKPIDDTPLTEIGTALLFVGSYLFWPYEFNSLGTTLFVFWLVFLVGFVALALYDLKWMLLPNKIVYPLIGLAVVQVLLVATYFDGGWDSLLGAFWGFVVGSGVFYGIFQLSKGKWIGGGDVKLGMVLGILAGGALESALLIFIASVFGTLFSIPLLVAGKAKAKMRIPFGPFLLAAMVVVYLFGADILSWYRDILIP